MRTVSVVFTAHNENGRCNSLELMSILEFIKPEAIFEEISPSRFDAYSVDRTIKTLESAAVEWYTRNFRSVHIPVDSDDVPKLEFKEKLDYMFDQIAAYNKEYSQLKYNRYQMAAQYGFDYLNGKKFAEVTQRIHQIEKSVIAQVGSLKLKQIYDCWINFNKKRERTIIENIFNSLNIGNFKNSVLLIGAEHRCGILEQVKNIQDMHQINWMQYRS